MTTEATTLLRTGTTDDGEEEGRAGPLTVKVLVGGRGGSGKTSFVRRVVTDAFSPDYRQSVGVDFHLHTIDLLGKIVRVQLWDIGGQEIYGSLSSIWCRKTDGAFIGFDITNPASFDQVLDWKKVIDRNVTLSNGEPIPCWLIAFKCDLPKEDHCKTAEELDNWSKEHKFQGWTWCSAKKPLGNDAAVNGLVTSICNTLDCETSCFTTLNTQEAPKTSPCCNC
ncbi:ADP ribosylation factor [Pelomyxa schiedti]|nr:ADP ribosylation factor [Pelomyxa schiedti]